MVNRPLLLSQMALYQIVPKQLAKELGRSASTIYRKINGKNDFTVDEILRCRKLLHLSPDLENEIFFESKLS